MRAGAWVLGVLLLFASVGCSSGVEQASGDAHQLQLGMSVDDVRAELGDPAQTVSGEPGGDTLWIYRYEGGPSAGVVILLVLFAILIVAALLMAGGGGSFGGGGGGGGEGPAGILRVRFDGTNHVTEILVEPAHP